VVQKSGTGRASQEEDTGRKHHSARCGCIFCPITQTPAPSPAPAPATVRQVAAASSGPSLGSRHCCSRVPSPRKPVARKVLGAP